MKFAPFNAVLNDATVRIMESQDKPQIPQPVCFFEAKSDAWTTKRTTASAPHPLVAVHKPHDSGGKHMEVGGGGPKQSQSAFKVLKMELNFCLLAGHCA